MKKTILCIFFMSFSLYAHIPALLLPVKGTPITSYYASQSEISRAIYSELTNEDDFFIVNLSLKTKEKFLLQLFSPYCTNIPQYEEFQPSALIIKGELSWKFQGETNREYINRLKTIAVKEVHSNYANGNRPVFYEEFGDMSYWVGGKFSGELESGLYSIVVYDQNNNKGNINVSFNEKEAWNPDLFEYVAQVLPGIKAGFCNPKGYTGNLEL